MKQLEEWVPEEGDDGEGGIEDVGVGGVVGGGGGGNSNGWSVHEMFAKNAEFGVETSYDPKLRGYTTELKVDKADDNQITQIIYLLSRMPIMMIGGRSSVRLRELLQKLRYNTIQPQQANHALSSFIQTTIHNLILIISPLKTCSPHSFERLLSSSTEIPCYQNAVSKKHIFAGK